jgi:hypothetical protein
MTPIALQANADPRGAFLAARKFLFALFVAFLFLSCRAATAQQLNCRPWNQVADFKGSVSMTSADSSSSHGETYQTNQSITFTFDANAPLLTCGGLITWTPTGTLTYSINDTLTNDCLPGDPRSTSVITFQGSGSVPGGPALYLAFASGVGFDFNANTYAAAGLGPALVTQTLTDCRGVVTTDANAQFTFGPSGPAHTGGVLFKNIPLPSSVQTLNGTFTDHIYNSTTGPGISLTWQFNWSIVPVQNFDVVLTSLPGHDWTTWRPTGGLTESDTGLDQNGGPNLLFLNAALVNKSTGEIRGDLLPDRVTFTLKDVSKEPGVAMNWPPKAQSVSTPDLTFDPLYHPAAAGYTVSSDATSVDLDPAVLGSGFNFPAVISPHDWGGWATLNVTIIVGNNTFTGHFQGDSATDIPIPKSQPGSHIADVWKTQNKVPLSTPDIDDSETDPDGLPGCVGDGLTLYEEYRGFMENGKHIEGDPNKKDFFVQNLIGADGEPGLSFFTELTHLNVHKDIRENEIDGGHTGPFGGPPGDRLINFNHGQGAHETEQHAVILAVCTGTDGGKTYLNQVGVRGRPKFTIISCMQGRDWPSRALSPDNLHRSSLMPAGSGVITPFGAFIQYDVGVAHELLHSVGVEHHGDVDPQGSVFNFLPPNNPQNTTGQPVFQRLGQYVRLLPEGGGPDAASTIWANAQKAYARCQTIVANPSQYDPIVVESCQRDLSKLNDSFPEGLYLAKPHGEHSGNDQCVMRYFFAHCYPSVAPLVGFPLYYLVPAGTEPVGSILDDSPAGTGINDPKRTLPVDHPQPRYFEAADRRGDCKHWVCVSDKYAPVPQ